MDVKRMHDMIEKLSERAECEFAKGIDNVDTCEMGKVVDMMKDLSEAMYYRTLTHAMDEVEPEETLSMMERFGDGRRFYDDYRYKTTGRYAPKGKGTYVGRRGYTEPPYWHRNPVYDRDFDLEEYDRMYYTDTKMANGTMDKTESRYDRAKRHYTETKAMHSGNTTDDKDEKMKALESYMKELGVDLSDMIKDMTEEEKNMMRSKLSTLVSKI